MRLHPKEEEAAKKKEEEERDRLKADWLNLLFTDQSVAAMSPEAWAGVGLWWSPSLLRNDAFCNYRVLCQQRTRVWASDPGRRKKLGSEPEHLEVVTWTVRMHW